MIVNIWKPSKNKEFYSLITIKKLVKNRYRDCKVVYECDFCNSNKLSFTSSRSMFIHKTIDHQKCKSCRTRMAEYVTKKSYIPFSIIQNSIKSENYDIITTESEYMEGNNRSQFRLSVKCNKNHLYKVTWNNWQRGKRCRKCYEENKYKNAIKHKNGYDLYLHKVNKLTEQNYKNYFNLINPKSFIRGKNDYHLDHIFSKYDGFKYNINPEIIASPVNLRMVEYNYNLTKNKKSDMTLERLLKEYYSFNR